MLNTLQFSLEQAEDGVLVSFPVPVKLPPKDRYILYFDSPVSLPSNSNNTITFEPMNGSYTIIGTSSFVPKVFIKIKSLYRIQSKTLIRLIIKDITNTIIYTDYILVICSPESSTTLSGKLLIPNAGGIGPNGGSLIQITGSNQSTSTILVGDKVVGPGVPDSPPVYVKSIVSSLMFELSRAMGNNLELSGSYTITRVLECVDPAAISNTVSSTLYTILDYINNWTYKVRDQIIAQFAVDDIDNNQELMVFLPIKNTALLAKDDAPYPIPETSIIKVGGRVINDTIPISDI
jgi:hypothetical protein